MKAFLVVFAIFTSFVGLVVIEFWIEAFNEAGLVALALGVYVLPVCYLMFVVPWQLVRHELEDE